MTNAKLKNIFSFRTQPESSDDEEKEIEKPILKNRRSISKPQSTRIFNSDPLPQTINKPETPIQYYPVPFSIPISVPIPVPYPVYSPPIQPQPSQLIPILTPINLNNSSSLPSFSNNYRVVTVAQPKKNIYNIINQPAQKQNNTTRKKLINPVKIVSIKKI
jgi:hypothetical protein